MKEEQQGKVTIVTLLMLQFHLKKKKGNEKKILSEFWVNTTPSATLLHLFPSDLRPVGFFKAGGKKSFQQVFWYSQLYFTNLRRGSVKPTLFFTNAAGLLSHQAALLRSVLVQGCRRVPAGPEGGGRCRPAPLRREGGERPPPSPGTAARARPGRAAGPAVGPWGAAATRGCAWTATPAWSSGPSSATRWGAVAAPGRLLGAGGAGRGGAVPGAWGGCRGRGLQEGHEYPCSGGLVSACPAPACGAARGMLRRCGSCG